MTTDLPHGTRIIHTHCPDQPCTETDHTQCTHTCPHGIGTVVRMIGSTTVVAQWQGVPLTRNEAREGVARWTPPPPPVRRTRRRSA